MCINKNQLFVFGGLFFVLFVWNLLFSPQSDDFAHYFSAIDSDRNFLTSYFTWNGRFGELLCTGFFGKLFFGSFSWLFDFLNALVGIVYFYVFFVLCFGRLPKDKTDFVILIFIFGLVCVLGQFGAVFLWGTGAFNYLWGVGIILCFLVPFRMFWGEIMRKHKNCEHTSSLRYATFLLLYGLTFGFMAGMSSELIGLLVAGAIFLSFLFALYKKIHLPIWYYVGFVSVASGWITLFLSPGSKERSMVLENLGTFIALSDFFNLSFWNMALVINQAINMGISPIFKIFLFIFALFFAFKNKIAGKYGGELFGVLLFVSFFVIGQQISVALMYGLVFYCMIKLARIENTKWIFVGLFAIWVLMVLATFQLISGIPPRARLGRDLVLLVIIVWIFKEFYLSYPKTMSLVSAGVFIIGVIFVSYGSLEVWKQGVLIEKIVSNKGAEDAVILPKSVQFDPLLRAYFLNYDLLLNEPNHWVNVQMAKFYGVKSLQVE